MPKEKPSSKTARFGPFLLDLRTGELERKGKKVRLQDQPLRILGLIIERPGELISREEIQSELWPNDTAVNFEYGINSAIMRLRAALRDSPTNPRYIETLARRGYRFLMPVEWVVTAAVDAVVQEIPKDESPSHYSILERLGSGGMGVVYKAKDLKLGRWVALKFLSEALAENGDALQRFQHEARAASALSHPNICTIYAVDEEQGRPFIVMELLEGQTLKELLQSRSLQIDELLELAIQISNALNAAHEKGIVHRDIKPANIFVNGRNHAKILDFGVARLDELNSHLSGPGVAMGTVAYMSPEQSRGDDLDGRTDIFSFGMVLEEMAAGLTLPPELNRIISKALEKDRGARYQTAADLNTDLMQVKREIDSDRILAAGRPPQAVPRRSRWQQHRRWVVAALSALFALILLTAALNLGGWRDRLLHQSEAQPIRSLAVLPFRNLSATDADAYLVEGTTELVVTDLAKLGKFDVISVPEEHNKKAHESLSTFARDVHADAIVRGTVLRDGRRVRVTVQLVLGETGRYVWADQYEGEASEILALQSKVAQSVAGQVLSSLNPSVAARPDKPRQVNPEAYDAYLRGRHFWNKRTPQNLEKAIGYFEQAINKDPSYASAYAGLADAYLLQGELGGRPRPDAFSRARTAADHALGLDPTLAEAHASLGALDRNEAKGAAAEQQFRRAIELNPSYATAYQWHAELLTQQGRFDEALTKINRAEQLDPLSLAINTRKGRILLLAGKYDQAVAQLKATVEMDPNFYMSHANLGDAYMQKRLYPEALREWQRSTQLNPRPYDEFRIAQLYAISGQSVRAKEMLPKLERLSQTDQIPLYELGIVHFFLGNRDEALNLMKAAAAKHEFQGELLSQRNPLFDRIRLDRQFAESLRRAGIKL